MADFAPAPIREFFVLPDDGLEPLLRPLRQAQDSIDIYIYKLTNKQIAAALREAVERGVQVRAIVDPAPGGDETAGWTAHDKLQNMGAHVRWAPPYFVKSHAKSFVVDGELALIASFNFVEDWEQTRDHGAITADAATVKGLAAAFEADWEERQLEGEIPQALVLSPNNSRAVVLGLLDAARKSVAVEHQQFTDGEIVEKLAALSRRGVEVDLITRAAEEKNRQHVERLRELAPAIRVAYHRKLDIHTKLLVADRGLMLIGSINLTGESLDRRREVGMLVSDEAAVERALAITRRDSMAG